jgi:hypothetical protein
VKGRDLSLLERKGSMTKREKEAKLESFRKEFDEQVTVFKQHLPRLIKRHPGKFVAIHQGRVLGLGKDERRLFRKVKKECKGGDKFILIQRIEREKEYEVT